MNELLLPEPQIVGIREIDFNEFEPVRAYTADQMREYAAAAVAAAVPPGWKVVPVEATEDMRFPSYLGISGPNWPTRKEVYRVMLAAAPEVPR